MPFLDSLKAAMPTFFGAAKSAPRGALPMPQGGNRPFWWGDNTGPIYPGLGVGGMGRQIDFTQAVGDVADNSAVAACLGWISTNWAAAPVQVGRDDADGKFDPTEGHPLVDLLNQPHEDYAGKWLIQALLADYYRQGNAYCHIVAGSGGVPAELEYLPAACTWPVPDRMGRLDHYEYKPKQQALPIDPADVVHFRHGIDPASILRGTPPLAPAYAEIVTDNAAARYGANLLFHGGLPPAILGLELAALDKMAPLDADTARMMAERMREWMRQHPGEAPLMPAALKLIELAWKPNDMVINDLREEPETRIAALFRLPPIVAGLRAGLIRSTYSNSEQAGQDAWRACLIPLQSDFAAEWTRQLLPRYGGAPGLRVRYDHSQVDVLQEDQQGKRQQAREDYKTGLVSHEEARAESGRAPLPELERKREQGAKDAAQSAGEARDQRG